MGRGNILKKETYNGKENRLDRRGKRAVWLWHDGRHLPEQGPGGQPRCAARHQPRFAGRGGQDGAAVHRGATTCPLRLSATTSRPEALEGADYCIISIEIGDRFELWEQDWRIAQQYGIRQVYGENGGPGGLFHSLRIIPPILEICGDVLEICPEATVFNFSNPMSRICTTVHRKYPDLQLIGLCHEIARCAITCRASWACPMRARDRGRRAEPL